MAEALAVEGRDLSSQHIKVGLPPVMDSAGRPDAERTMAQAPAYLEAGGTIITVTSPPNPESMSDIYRFIEDVAKAKAALS